MDSKKVEMESEATSKAAVKREGAPMIKGHDIRHHSVKWDSSSATDMPIPTCAGSKI